MDNLQQVLPVFSSNDNAYFDSFYVADSLRMLVGSLQQLVKKQAPDFVFISGQAGLGKSHLLQAVCHLAQSLEQSSLYIPLADVAEFSPVDVLAGHEKTHTLCLDDVHCIAGKSDWEEALFDLYNVRTAQGLPLYVSAKMPAALLPIKLADLQSRLSAILSFQLTELSDEDKAALLRFRAAQRGIDLNASCLTFIIQRSHRDVNELILLLDKLDQSSLSQGRKITVPFIKSVMHW